VIRGLTVRQPWAWAIIHGGKDVENRSRSLGQYRGPVAIHAGLAADPAGFDSLDVLVALMVDGIGRAPSPQASKAARGAVLGIVDLVDVHENEAYPWADPPVPSCSDWAQHGSLHLVLANPRPLSDPIPWRGRLGLWTVPPDLDAAIREQVTL
jgi:hypothetical protein